MLATSVSHPSVEVRNPQADQPISGLGQSEDGSCSMHIIRASHASFSADSFHTDSVAVHIEGGTNHIVGSVIACFVRAVEGGFRLK